jgi:hypothetical protein
MDFCLEAQVICVKMEPGKPGVPILTGRTPALCPLLQVNHEARTETLNVVEPYIYDKNGFPVVYINFRLDTILFDDYKSFDQFWKSVERPGWREMVVPHIALFQATWKKLYNPLLCAGHYDEVEDEAMSLDTLLNCMAWIWFWGVRDVTILVTGKDTYHRSAIKFETPKESPLESGIAKSKDWESLEREIAEDIKYLQDMGIEELAGHREGMPQISYHLSISDFPSK